MTVTLARNAGAFASARVTGRVLPDISKPTPTVSAASPSKITPDMVASMTPEAIAAMLNSLAANAKTTGRFSAKVTEKGCLSVHVAGLRRFGASFYASEWEAILSHADDIRAALEANVDTLAHKG